MLKKVLMFSLLISLATAKGYFSDSPDICDPNEVYEGCSDDTVLIKNLQTVLNSDSNLSVTLDVDGVWGEQTAKAVKKLQEQYQLEKVDGWVGKSTKSILDRLAQGQTLLKPTANTAKCYGEFCKRTNLRKSFKVYQNKQLLKLAKPSNTKIKVDISEQRVRLYVNNKVALCAPCTTGAKRKFEPNTKIYRDKRTPKGTFKITEKIKDKRSSIFGEYYKGKKMVYKGDKRKYKGDKRKVKYVGASLKNWMRITSSGIGFHTSQYVKRHPGTNGCIRLQDKVARTLFSKVSVGTPVQIVN